MTGIEFVEICKADKCSTQSRSKNGQKYHNKYSECLGKLGYAGINSKGVHTKKYSYGVVGHCCEGVEAHFIWAGLEEFVPKFKSGTYKYINNTNVYRKWLMTEPTIEGFGKVDYVKDPSEVKVGAVAFKGDGKNKNSATHTCVFISYDAKTGVVETVDFNVSDGKGHNNGTIKKRNKKYFVGFANMPYPKKSKTNDPTTAKKIDSDRLEVGVTYELLEDMTIRTGASVNANKTKADKMTAYAKEHLTSDGLLAKGTHITFNAVYKDAKGAEWVKLASGYMCAIGSKGKFFVAKVGEIEPDPTDKTQYATFPMKVLRFSALWNTSTPHKKCSGGTPKDYPTDLVGADTGKDWFYAPCDLVCLKVYSKASHGLWFRSAAPVNMPVGKGYLYMMVEHESVKGFKVGQKIRKGEKMFTENKYGNATGNHLHFSCGWSKSIKDLGSGWRKNSKGAWVLYVAGVTNIKIYDAFYVDPSFTIIKDKRETLKNLPK